MDTLSARLQGPKACQFPLVEIRVQVAFSMTWLFLLLPAQWSQGQHHRSHQPAIQPRLPSYLAFGSSAKTPMLQQLLQAKLSKNLHRLLKLVESWLRHSSGC